MLTDELANGTEQIELSTAGGPPEIQRFDGELLGIPSPPPPIFYFRSASTSLWSTAAGTPSPYQIHEFRRGVMNDEGVWRYRWDRSVDHAC